MPGDSNEEHRRAVCSGIRDVSSTFSGGFQRMSSLGNSLLDEVIVGKSLSFENRYRAGGPACETATGTGFLADAGVHHAKL
jgi:hypothetical protein